MNLFENLTRLNENDANDVIEQLIATEIPFKDNSENDITKQNGRFTLYNGLIEIFEPDDDVEEYKAVLAAELSDIDEIIEALKEEGATSEQFEAIRNIVGDNFISIDDEDICDVINNAFPIEEISDESEIAVTEPESEVVDEVVIEEESATLKEDALEEITYKTSHRIDYIKDTLDWIESLNEIPVSINQLVVKMYSLASNIEDEIAKINKD